MTERHSVRSIVIVLWWCGHAPAHEPTEIDGHEESDENEAQNDDEGQVEKEIGDEAPGRHLVDVTREIALLKTGDGGFEVRICVELSGRVSPSFDVEIERLADGSIHFVAFDRGGIGVDVGLHIEHVAIDDLKETNFTLSAAAAMNAYTSKEIGNLR